MKIGIGRIILVLMFVLLLSINLFAQTGTISGTVYNYSQKTGSLYILVFDQVIDPNIGLFQALMQAKGYIKVPAPVFPYSYSVVVNGYSESTDYYVLAVLDVGADGQIDPRNDVISAHEAMVRITSGAASEIDIYLGERPAEGQVITGTISYSGSISMNKIIIAAFPLESPRVPRHGTIITQLGKYTIYRVRTGKYIVRALYDDDGDGLWDVVGTYSGIVEIKKDTPVENVDITMRDNNSPVILDFDPPVSAVTGELYKYHVNAYEPDGDSLFFKILRGPEGLGIHPKDGTIYWTPVNFHIGSHPVVVAAYDWWGKFTYRDFIIEVTQGADKESPIIVYGPTIVRADTNYAVIVYATNELAWGAVTYAENALWSNTNNWITIENDTLKQKHVFILTGLKSNTEYRYYVAAFDSAGNEPTLSQELTFKTRLIQDVTPPAFVGFPTTSGTDTSSTKVIFKTNEPTTGIVEIQEDGVIDNVVQFKSEELKLVHIVDITGLKTDTRYYYRILIEDAFGNGPVASDMFDFRTTGLPDNTPPVITNAAVAVNVETDKAEIVWKTNEVSTSVVYYEIDSLYNRGQFLLAFDNDLTTDHRVTIHNLRPGTWYGFKAASLDANNNGPTLSAKGRFKTKLKDDTQPPVIVGSAYADRVDTNRAVIIWKTDEAGNSILEYGKKSEWPNNTVELKYDEYVNYHNIELVNLEPGTEYKFKVGSADKKGNGPTWSKVLEFQTPLHADIRAPVIIGIPTGQIVDSTTAAIKWLTDEPSNSIVYYELRQSYSVSQKEIKYQDLTRAHMVYLTDLIQGQEYLFRVASYDKNFNGPTYSKIHVLKIPDRADEDPPVIIGFPVEKGIDSSSVTILWKTDEPSNSIVEISKTVNWPDSASAFSNDNISDLHSVFISNLEEGTEYTYKVNSTDINGNGPTTSDTKTFKTAVGKDVTAPLTIYGPGVFNIDTCKAIVVWAVNEISDGYVEYGESTSYGQSTSVNENRIEHRLTLTNLLPDTEYNFRVHSRDLNGNESTSQNFTFRTLAEITLLDSVKAEIVAGPIAADIEYNRAVIKWKTNVNTSSLVRYGFDTDYDNEISANESINVQNHLIVLTNLVSDTLYNFQVVSRTDQNLEVVSDNFTFRTKFEPDTSAPVIIEGPITTKTEQNNAVIAWKTDKLSDSQVEYGIDESFDNLIKSDTEEGVRLHRLIIYGLDSNTEYDVRVSSTALNGKTVTSDIFSFKTKGVPDTTSPKITAGPSPAQIQHNKVIIVWTTDEPSDSYMKYGTDINNLLEQWNEDQMQGVQDHEVVLTNLEPDTKYYYRVFSRDLSQNKNRAASILKYFTTAAAPDTSSPVIVYGPVVTSLDQSAKFSWGTDEQSDSYIYYRIKDSGNNYDFTGDETKVKDHEVTVTNLTPGAEYEFVIVSRDFEGNETIWPEGTTLEKMSDGKVKIYKVKQPPGGDGTFVTNENPDTQNPIFISDPTVAAKTSNSVTIEWETDESSDSYIEYYLGDSLIETIGDAQYVTKHSIVLTNLQLATLYNFYAKSSDVSRNGPVTSQQSVFETLPEEDVDPPVIISDPVLTGSTNSLATIFWKTDENSNTSIEYGTDSLSLITTKSEIDLVENHEITITNLQANTKYYYRVSSTDGDNNGPTWSEIKNFTTNSTPDLEAPVISNVSSWSVKNNRVTLGWDTDELSDSFIDYGTDETLGNKIAVTDKVSVHEMAITNLTSNTTYYYTVGSVDLSGNIAETTEIYSFTTAATEDTEAPDTPTEFEVFTGNEAALLKWNSNTEGDFEGYNIYRDGSLIATGVTDTFYYNYGLENGTSYAYKIEAYDDNLPDHNISPATDELTANPSSDHLISAPVLVYPEDDMDVASVFTFIADASANRSSERPDLTYQIAVSQDETFYDMIIFKRGITETALKVEYLLDENLEHNQQYWWKVKADDGAFKSEWSEIRSFTVDTTIVVGIEDKKVLPVRYKLYVNYPNPFNPYTNIKFDIPVQSDVTLKIYNILGQEVKTLLSEKLAPGSYKKLWDGRNDIGLKVASGLYFYRIKAGKFIDTKKMVLLK